MSPATAVKSMLVLGVSVLLFLSPACKSVQKSKKNSPAQVSEKFFSLLKDQEYEKACELATEKTARLIRTIQTLSEMAGNINVLRDNKKELVGCEVTADKAVCTYKAFSGPDEKVYLVREKGKWLVDLMESDVKK
jgi:hypothetical protein